MTKYSKYPKLIIFLIATFLIYSCNDFLDIAEEDEMSFDKIWLKRNTIEQYLNNTWGYMPNPSEIQYASPYFAATDEASISFPRDWTYITFGTWNPSNIPYNNFAKYYQGIREANVFMQNIVNVNVIDVSDEEKITWYTEARFARAYYYYLLIQMYGPVILVGDEPVDFNKEKSELYAQRNTMDECVNYVISEMEACAVTLPSSWPTFYYGKPTKGACYAVISSISLHAARPLFNGNSMYKDMKNPDGSLLFPNIEIMNSAKWERAATAAKRIIDMDIYDLHKVYNADESLNPVKSYQGIMLDLWNDEIIFGRYLSGMTIRRLTNPRVTAGSGAWGAYAPTQQQVDAYAMSNGIYPITGYNSDGSPIIDDASGYVETGFVNFAHPLDQPAGYTKSKLTYNMYVNREPRFYASILWSGCDLPYLQSNKVVNFAFNGNSGPGQSPNSPNTGYLVRKYTDPSLNNNAQQWGELSFPIFRYAEILLNYIEALNEYDPTNSDIQKYINVIRERAGVPSIESVYPEAVNNQSLMRELIRRERRIELAFEAKRYHDTRTWMIAKEVDSGPMWGMNVSPDAPSSNLHVTPDEFWERTIFEHRVFDDNFYLFPFSQTELNMNHDLIQNYGW